MIVNKPICDCGYGAKPEYNMHLRWCDGTLTPRCKHCKLTKNEGKHWGNKFLTGKVVTVHQYEEE